MIQDKELLLKDLCARLPYGVKVLVDNKTWCDFDGRTPSKLTFENSYRLLYVGTNLGYVKPYLFPLSSMTEEQKKTLKVLCDWNDEEADAQSILVLYQKHFVMKTDVIDWFHKNHFDYRGLIPIGLAIDATGLNIY